MTKIKTLQMFKSNQYSERKSVILIDGRAGYQIFPLKQEVFVIQIKTYKSTKTSKNTRLFQPSADLKNTSQVQVKYLFQPFKACRKQFTRCPKHKINISGRQ